MNDQHAPAPRLLSSPEATVVAELLLPDVFKRFTTDLLRSPARRSLLRNRNSRKTLRKSESLPVPSSRPRSLGSGRFSHFTATLIAAIALALPLWAAALIVTILSLAGAAGAADPIPRLMRNLHVDAETLKMVLVKDCSRIRLVMRDRASTVRLRSFCFRRIKRGVSFDFQGITFAPYARSDA